MKPQLLILTLIVWAVAGVVKPAAGQSSNGKKLTVIAYYGGDAAAIDRYPVEKLTHIIYSFCYLRNNQLVTGGTDANKAIRKLVSLKKKHPGLKVLLSLGGWGGCKTCSEAFSTAEGRLVFARSTKKMIDSFMADGIDLDWEYPAIEGPPGHRFAPEDRPNFTELVRVLRKELGDKLEISFAAGGFPKFLEQSIEWTKVMPLLDRVNIMSYDLVHGYSVATGHHTPLYSNATQVESADDAVRYLDSLGIPRSKIVIGAAFYARVFSGVDSVNNGLSRPGKFKSSVAYKTFISDFTPGNGYQCYWDSTASAPYCYNAVTKTFATFDNLRSVRLKTRYAIDRGLNGIMFWELKLDKNSGGLLDEIYKAKQEGR
ncbi:MAG: glycoside hydrolase family 18 protein [Candidatus Pseudobacter hemicellulosilyticus]|uniref:chitinase n=1 Tax=Candidatus Pseudobacter hemicellulosilyticus TaxID=3121375 RepID=A0AAJ5WZ51_9BACT|nr:MAG: glycoside hydrolase family 18 protein [Pseudobacter sp.]